jgi:hypothetical protein
MEQAADGRAGRTRGYRGSTYSSGVKHPANRAAGAVLVVLMALTSGACDAMSGHPCTLIGAESGIVATYDEVRQTYPNQQLQVEVCLEDDCKTERGDGEPFLRAGSETLHDSSPVEVSVTISDETGTTVFDAQTTVTPEKHQPNGSGCDPTVWVGGVEATADGQLRAGSPSRR